MPAFRFGDFEFDAPDLLNWRRNGSTFACSSSRPASLPFYSIIAVAGNAGTDPRCHLGDDTFVDFEQGLNYCIRQIRLALNDQAEKPLYIETVPRLGYRFIASAETVTAEATQAAPGQTARGNRG